MTQHLFRYRRLLVSPLVAILTIFLFTASFAGLPAHAAPATSSPSITITSVTDPVTGGCLATAGPIVITVNVTGFTPTSVTFLLDGTTVIGTSSMSPFTFTWTTNIPHGPHGLMAQAPFGQETITSEGHGVFIFTSC